MSLTKFYHYNIWIAGDDGRRLNPIEVIDNGAFSTDLYRIPKSGDRNYHAQYREVDTNLYYGVIIRTKDEDDFVRLSPDGRLGPLSEATEDRGEAGDIDYDYVDFAIRVDGTKIDLLIKVGFQTPGIGIVRDYLEEHIEFDDEFDIEHETDLRDFDDDKVERLLDSTLKKVEISFKKNPQTYPELDPDDTIRTLIDDSYRLKIEASLHQDKNADATRVDEFVNHFSSILGVNEDSAEQSISQIDFPRIMHTFRIEGVESDDEEIEDNLADIVKKEEIDTSGYGIFDPDLGEELCERI
ncbi:hypothetical protein [Natrarchaeobius oligotrophus]|uniref:Uncharacterized protein n=1 Tax=Natrarchaeobius chitinivorans TaxID=1679083 RepID=A0A3N6M3X8_NATCH|nr:hypothetical protein [Natrarchaeobius chitinivorans]RQG98183.1 hypothetical protein EA472_18645 [Natrarchaeobius chitinivorans]